MDTEKALDLVRLIPESLAMPLVLISIALFILLFPRVLPPWSRILVASVLAVIALILVLLAGP